jgi:hypothetical protein
MINPAMPPYMSAAVGLRKNGQFNREKTYEFTAEFAETAEKNR